jgi:hypothetical protein
LGGFWIRRAGDPSEICLVQAADEASVPLGTLLAGATGCPAGAPPVRSSFATLSDGCAPLPFQYSIRSSFKSTDAGLVRGL